MKINEPFISRSARVTMAIMAITLLSTMACRELDELQEEQCTLIEASNPTTGNCEWVDSCTTRWDPCNPGSPCEGLSVDVACAGDKRGVRSRQNSEAVSIPTIRS